MPLSEPALALLPALPEDITNGDKFVFDPSLHWGRDKAALDKRIAERRGSPLEPWRLHDLRHTFVTTMSELGFAEPHVVEAIVNHMSGVKSGIAGRYNHASYLEQRIEALGKWGRYLTGLVGCPLSSDQRNTTEKSDENRGELASGTQ